MEAPTDVPNGVPDSVPAVEPLADGDEHDQNPIVPENPDGGEEIERGWRLLGGLLGGLWGGL